MALAVCITLLLSTANYPRAQTAAGIAIRNVAYTGDVQLPAEETSRLTAQLKSADLYGPDWKTELEQRAMAFWQDHGYFKVAAPATVQPITDVGGTHIFDVSFEVRAGKQYRLRNLEFRGAHVDVQALRRLIPIQTGDIFARSKIVAGLDNLRRAYGELGYINFTSVPDTQVNDAGGTIDLLIDLDEGPQYTVRNVDLTGIAPELAATLRRRLLLRPGDVYNHRLAEYFFRQNADLLPRGSTPEKNLILTRDDVAHTVNLTYDFANTTR
ncbi:MAG TPA: POTRA domain-containing protein [Terriglobales bacterium]|nr:POTRA domain-containing protein [Terriglobales bacterium]